jgi:Helix-turn-helix domain
MSAEPAPVSLQCKRRVHAALALFQGVSVAEVSTQYRLCRSALYKFRARALAAMRAALVDHPRGPKRPHNRLAPHLEEAVVACCQRHPTLSSDQVEERFGNDAPTARTIQRIRQRHGLARLPKRAPATRLARCLPPETIRSAKAVIQAKPFLEPERTAWNV